MAFEAERDFVASLFDTSITCPHCGHVEDGGESENAQHVVSYWGEDLHDFCCPDCGKDFIVREVVRRLFDTGKTVADLEGK